MDRAHVRHSGQRKHSGRPYVAAWLGLTLLTVASFAMSYLPLGTASPFVAFGVAFAKSLIVALVFMHLSQASFASKMVALVNVLFVLLICLGVVADVALR